MRTILASTLLLLAAACTADQRDCSAPGTDPSLAAPRDAAGRGAAPCAASPSHRLTSDRSLIVTVTSWWRAAAASGDGVVPVQLSADQRLQLPDSLQHLDSIFTVTGGSAHAWSLVVRRTRVAEPGLRWSTTMPGSIVSSDGWIQAGRAVVEGGMGQGSWRGVAVLVDRYGRLVRTPGLVVVDLSSLGDALWPPGVKAVRDSITVSHGDVRWIVSDIKVAGPGAPDALLKVDVPTPLPAASIDARLPSDAPRPPSGAA